MKVVAKKASVSNQVRLTQNTEEMLRRALERIIQLYTDKSHFVYELLQNAEDAGATRIKFLEKEDRLEVLHNGTPFSVGNLQSLCDIGMSDKSSELNQIGEFGVGFKSVFGICDTVYLYSNPSEKDKKNGFEEFAVVINDFVKPTDIELKKIDEGYTTKFVFPYNLGFNFSGFPSYEKLIEVLSRRLQNLGITTLLFMKHLQAIDYEIDLPGFSDIGSYKLNKERINDHCSFVSARDESTNKEAGEKESFLIFTRPVKEIKKGQTIDIAFSVETGEDGKWVFKKAKNPFISVYFPTETESKSKFIVQGPYRTTPNRSSVPSDDPDNISLAKQTASLLRDSVLELRDQQKLDYTLLNILPFDEDDFENAPLFIELCHETRNMFEEEDILLGKEESYENCENVKIARASELPEIFSDQLLTELIDDSKEYHWLPTFLTETNTTYKSLYSFLVGSLAIDVIRPEHLRDYFNTNRAFLFEREDDWLVRLYNMYDSVGAAFSKQKSGTNMLTAEFIKTSTGNFVAPYRKSDDQYIPNVFLPDDNTYEEEDINYVDKYVLGHCRHFFKEILGLQKPNEYETFIKDFRQRYSAGITIDDEQKMTDLKKLLFYRAKDNYFSEVDALIKQYIELKCFSNGKGVYVNPSKEKVLFSNNELGMSLEQYFKNVKDYPFVDVDSYEMEDITREDLEAIGVTADISIGMDKKEGEYYVERRGRNPRWATYGDFRWTLSLEELDGVLEYISAHPSEPDSFAKSSFIFHFLKAHESMLQGTLYIKGNDNNKPGTYANIVSKLRRDGPKHEYYGVNWDGKWLYNESLELVSQKEISKRELNRSLYGEIDPESSLYEYLGFVKSKEDELEEIGKQYDQLDENTKEQYFEIELKRRYGLSVSELNDQFSSKSEVAIGEDFATQDHFEFPSSKVKNWDLLRRHVAEVLVFASPVKYEYKVRKLRVSRTEREIEAYLRSNYKVFGSNKYACQMCHQPTSRFEKTQLTLNMEKELNPLYLCLCPACASAYREMRSNENTMETFLTRIKILNSDDIGNSDPVKVDCAEETVWFTQTHIAEISELIHLREEADKADSQAITNNAVKEEENSSSGLDVYKELTGKHVRHKSAGEGVVTECDGKYLKIMFDSGQRAKQIVKYKLENLLSSELIEILD